MNVLATTHVDSHGHKLAIEALESIRDYINNDVTIRMGLLHDPLFPPLGQYVNARIIKDEKGEFLLIADPNLFEEFRDTSVNEYVENYSSSGSRSFNEVKRDYIENNKFVFDTSAFENNSQLKDILEFISKTVKGAQIQEKIRKSLLNDPEFIIELGKTYLLYTLAKPIIEKLTEKVVTNISDDLYMKYEGVKKVVVRVFEYFKVHKRPVTIIFELPTDKIHLELVARIYEKDLNDLCELINPEKFEDIYKKAQNLKNIFGGQKFQFIFDDNEWKLNYILTEEGTVIGKKETFDKRDKVYKNLLENGKLFNSIGIGVGKLQNK